MLKTWLYTIKIKSLILEKGKRFYLITGCCLSRDKNTSWFADEFPDQSSRISWFVDKLSIPEHTDSDMVGKGGRTPGQFKLLIYIVPKNRPRIPCIKTKIIPHPPLEKFSGPAHVLLGYMYIQVKRFVLDDNIGK